MRAKVFKFLYTIRTTKCITEKLTCPNLFLPSFSIFLFFLVMNMELFVIDFEIWVWHGVLCIRESATSCLSFPLFVHFTEFSVPIRAVVFIVCIHLKDDQVCCV